LEKSRLAALFSDNACVASGKKRGFCRLPRRVGTLGPAFFFGQELFSSERSPGWG
jgi:hypothetical protein